MQMMPTTSWPQRVLGVARVSDWTAVDAVDMVPPAMVFLPAILNLRSIHNFVTRLSNLDTIRVMSQSRLTNSTDINPWRSAFNNVLLGTGVAQRINKRDKAS